MDIQLTSMQWCRGRILNRSRSRRLVRWRFLIRARRSFAPEHRVLPATPEHRPDAVDRCMCDRRQQLPQVHGREPRQLDHLWMVLGPAQGVPGRGWSVLEGGGIPTRRKRTLHMLGMIAKRMDIASELAYVYYSKCMSITTLATTIVTLHLPTFALQR
jgi:hypothetical protein